MPTREELTQLQSLPLEVKIKKTEQRIKEWVDHWGEDGVYISFSGGKDSTVLLDIARRLYPNLKALFVDTGLEFPEIRNFVRTYNNVDWLKPKKNFRQVVLEDGYPFISKEVSECVYGARRFLKYVLNGGLGRPKYDYTPSALDIIKDEHERLAGGGKGTHYYCYETSHLLGTCRQFSKSADDSGGGQITSIANSEEVANILNQSKGEYSTLATTERCIRKNAISFSWMLRLKFLQSVAIS